MDLEKLDGEQNIHFNKVWDIGPDQLQKIIDDVIIIDVRMKEEISGELRSIPGALEIPLIEIIDASNNLPKDKTLVLTCRNGWRSARAADYLIQNGFTKVYNLKGGLLYWNEFQDLSSESSERL